MNVTELKALLAARRMERGAIVRLGGDGAVALARAWAVEVGAESALDPLEARHRCTGPLWLHEGAGAVGLADAMSARAAVGATHPEVVLTGPCAYAGSRDVAVEVQVPGNPSSAEGFTRMLGTDGPDVHEAFDGGDFTAAHIAWERDGRPPGLSWIDVVADTLARRFARGRRTGWQTVHESAPGWGSFALAHLAFHQFDHRTVRQLLDDEVELPASRGLLAIVRGGACPNDAPRWVRALHVSHFGGEPPACRFWEAVLAYQDTPEVGAASGIVFLQPGRDRLPAAFAEAERIWQSIKRGEQPRDPFPPIDLLGLLGHVYGAIDVIRAFALGDTLAVRRYLEQERFVGFEQLAPGLRERLLDVRGHPWEEIRWLQVLERSEGAGERARERLAELPLERVFGDYWLEQILGEGASGSVWEARHMPTASPVALKHLHRTDDRALELFEREIEVVARLEHPAIAATLDRGVYEGKPFLVMEIADGTLEDELGLLDFESVRAVVVSILDALGYAHARGVLHRDLKPANVLLVADGTIRLADFGLAALPRTGAIAGTPAYMAPEQLEGQVSPSSDLYAVGMLAWALLTGGPAWFGDWERQRRIDRSKLPRFRPTRRVPVGFEAWLEHALAVRPEDRFRSAAEMGAALQQLGTVDDEAIGKAPVLRREQRTFELGQLLDLPPDLAVALTEDPLTKPWLGVERLQWRPRVPTASLLDAGDPPLLFREEAQTRLWLLLLRAVGRPRTSRVLLRGPLGSGRRSLVHWLILEARKTGLSPRGRSVVRLGSVDEPSVPGTLEVWREPPPSGPYEIVELSRFRPFQIFCILRSRLLLSLQMTRRAAWLSQGNLDLALAHVRDWLDEPTVAPTPQGLRPVGPLEPSGPAAVAWWRERVRGLAPEERASWAVLAAQLEGFVGSIARTCLKRHGLPVPDLDALSESRGDRRLCPPALTLVLDGLAEEAIAVQLARELVRERPEEPRFGMALALRDPAIDDVGPLVADVPLASSVGESARRVAVRLVKGGASCDGPTWAQLHARSEGARYLAADALPDEPELATIHHARTFFRTPAKIPVADLEFLVDALAPGWFRVQAARMLARRTRGRSPSLERVPDPQAFVAMEGLVARAIHGESGVRQELEALLRREGVAPAARSLATGIYLQLLVDLGEDDAAVAALGQGDSPLLQNLLGVAMVELLAGDWESARARLERIVLTSRDTTILVRVAFLLLLPLYQHVPGAVWSDLKALAIVVEDGGVARVLGIVLERVEDPERRAELEELARACRPR